MGFNMSFYENYLNSDGWRKKRQERLEIDHHECQTCTSQEDVEVHHRHYNALGNQNVETDLITLCRLCHNAITDVIRRRRYTHKDITITIVEEADNRRQNNGVDRKTIQINFNSSADTPQRADSRPDKQILEIDETDFVEESEDRC